MCVVYANYCNSHSSIRGNIWAQPSYYSIPSSGSGLQVNHPKMNSEWENGGYEYVDEKI